jgi:hypothetical protein
MYLRIFICSLVPGGSVVSQFVSNRLKCKKFTDNDIDDDVNFLGQLWPLCKDNSDHYFKTTRTTFPGQLGPLLSVKSDPFLATFRSVLTTFPGRLRSIFSIKSNPFLGQLWPLCKDNSDQFLKTTHKILGLLYKRALFDLQFVHNLFWLKLKWNARSKLFYCVSFIVPPCFDKAFEHFPIGSNVNLCPQASTLTYFSTCPFGQLTTKSICPTQSFSCPKKFIKITKTTAGPGLDINVCPIVRYQWKLTSDK